MKVESLLKTLLAFCILPASLGRGAAERENRERPQEALHHGVNIRMEAVNRPYIAMLEPVVKLLAAMTATTGGDAGGLHPHLVGSTHSLIFVDRGGIITNENERRQDRKLNKEETRSLGGNIFEGNLLDLQNEQASNSNSLQTGDTYYEDEQGPPAQQDDWQPQLDGSDSPDENDSSVLVNTFKIYGSAYVISLFAFCFLRKRFPRIYNVRSWAPNVQTKLALIEYGYIDWSWRVFEVSDETIREECGMDALCYLRAFRFGFRIALVGCFNSIYLLPVYKLSGNNKAKDVLGELTASHISLGSLRLMATVVASYIFFGCLLYLLLQELRWFIKHRHHFLSSFEPANYTVFVRNIPEEFRSSARLLAFFKQVFSDDAVLDANITMKNPELKKKVIRRDEILEKLEHEIARKNTKVDYSEASIQHLKLVFRDLSREIALERTSYWHKKQNDPSLLDREVVQERQDSPSDENALPSLNEETVLIARSDTVGLPLIQGRPPRFRSMSACSDISDNTASDDKQLPSLNEETVLIVRSDTVGLPLIQGRPPRFRRMSACSDISDNTASDDKQTAAVATRRIHKPPSGSASLPSSKGSRVPLVRTSSSFLSDCGTTSTSDSLGSAPSLVKKELNKKKPPNRLYSSASTASSCASRAVKDRISATVHNAKHAVAAAAHTVEDLAETALGIQFHNEDGVEHDAGFVTFTKLSTVYAALSMVQHSEPWVMDVEAAPAPDSIFWSNVGRPHQSVQTGRVMGLCASFALIVVWTIPVSFIASLTDIETLKESLDFLAEWTEAAPWLEPALNQAAPLLILVLNGTILPVLLKQISKLEGPISEAGLNSSVFVKMAVFMFIQTFFVSAFSGSIVSELTLILEEPKRIMKILASSLPSQSTYFLQMALVATFLGMAGEMLRVVPIYKAIVRSMIGHNLTEKERSKPTAGFGPISVPEEICFSTVFSADMLFFVILLFFNSNAPMVNWIIAFCFLILESSYRYQIFHNRPKLPDSGGRFWIEFINILQVFIVVAQVSLIGFLATKNATNVMPVMVPLLLATLVFIQYVHQRHYWVALNLPANECATVDLKNGRDEVNFEKLKGHFLHPALRSDHIEIDWDHGKPKAAVVEKRLSIQNVQNGDLIPGAVVAGRVSSKTTYDCSANGEMDHRRDGPSSRDGDSPGRVQSIPAGTVSGILVSNNTHHPANFNMDCAQHSSSIGMERLGDNASSYSNGSLGREQHLINTYHRSVNVERDSRRDGGQSYYSRANPSSHDGLVPGGERLIPGTVVVGAPTSNANRRSANGESEMNLNRNDRSFRRQDIQSEYDGSHQGRRHLVPATVVGASSNTHHHPVRNVEMNRRLNDRSFGRPGKVSSHDGFRGTDRLIPGTVRGSSSNTNRRSANGERDLKQNHRTYGMQNNPSAYDGSQGTEGLIPGTVSGASSNRYHHSGRTVDRCHKRENPPPLRDGYPRRENSTHQDTWDVERGVVAPKNWANYVQGDSIGKDAAPVETMHPLKW